MSIPLPRLALFLLLAGLLVWTAFDWVTDQLDVARRERDSAQFEVTGLRNAARISGEMLAVRDDIDRKRTQVLTHALNQNHELRRDVDDGRQRLRIKARCPATVPADSGTGRLADAGTAELAADARPDYFTLRDQLALSRQMVLGLQDHALRVCRR